MVRFFLAGFVSLCLGASVVESAESPRLNVLWLIAEDFGPHLSCCGTKEVWTPTIDG